MLKIHVEVFIATHLLVRERDPFSVYDVTRHTSSASSVTRATVSPRTFLPPVSQTHR